MITTSETATTPPPDMIDSLSRYAARHSGPTAGAYMKAIDRLRAFMLGRGLEPATVPTEAMLTEWYATMLHDGLTPNTASYYLANIGSLCNAAARDGAMETTDAFARVKTAIRDAGPAASAVLVTDDDFNRLVSMAATTGRLTGETAVLTDLLLYSLLSGATPPAEIARLKKSDIADTPEECDAIARRHIDARRSYVFPLGQTHKSPAALERWVNDRMAALMRMRNLPCHGPVPQAVASLWAYAALKADISAPEVLGVIRRRPVGIPALAFTSPTAVTPSRRADIIAVVARTIAANPAGWYAMRLRPGVEYAHVAGRVGRLDFRAGIPELYYPVEEIVKRVGSKLLHTSRPYIRDVVFFRSRPSDIAPLFHHIGDLAWCYRSDNSYARISTAEMHTFRMMIGQLTPDIEPVAPDASRFAAGTRVRITGGELAGYTAIVDSARSDTQPRCLLTLSLLGFEFMSWQVRIDSRYVEPLE